MFQPTNSMKLTQPNLIPWMVFVGWNFILSLKLGWVEVYSFNSFNPNRTTIYISLFYYSYINIYIWFILVFSKIGFWWIWKFSKWYRNITLIVIFYFKIINKSSIIYKHETFNHNMSTQLDSCGLSYFLHMQWIGLKISQPNRLKVIAFSHSVSIC